MIVLDTNVVIALLLRSPDIVRLRFTSALASQTTVAVPVIALFELQYGIARGTRRSENEQRLADFQRAPIVILPFEVEDAVIAGEVRAGLVAKGTPIGPYDTLIAAQALRHNATLITANTREFARVQGLRLEDWTK